MPVSLATFVCVLVARCQRVRRFMAPETGPIFQLERSVITSVLHAVQFDLIGIASFPSAISPILLYTRACKHSCTCPHAHTQIHGGVHTHTNTPKSDVPRQTTFWSFSTAGLSPHSTTPPCHSSRDQVSLFALLVVFKLF